MTNDSITIPSWALGILATLFIAALTFAFNFAYRFFKVSSRVDAAWHGIEDLREQLREQQLDKRVSVLEDRSSARRDDSQVNFQIPMHMRGKKPPRDDDT